MKKCEAKREVSPPNSLDATQQQIVLETQFTKAVWLIEGSLGSTEGSSGSSSTLDPLLEPEPEPEWVESSLDPDRCLFTIERYITDDSIPGSGWSRVAGENSCTSDEILNSYGAKACQNRHLGGMLRRVSNCNWTLLVIGLGLLDWLHICFNVANLNFILDDIAVFGEPREVQIHRTLCYICISIYLVRLICQPMIVLCRSALACTQGTTLVALWDDHVRWFTAICFNSFLILPAMMFFKNPFRDSAKTVRESYVRMGSDGVRDYVAGAILLLNCMKKTINGYLVSIP